MGDEFFKDQGLIGAVDAGLFDANTILKADTDDTPEALTIAASRIVARLAAGEIIAATIQQVLNLLMTTKGDLIVRNATVPDILSVGSDGEFLVPNSSTSTSLEWVGIVTYEDVVVVNDGQVVYN